MHNLRHGSLQVRVERLADDLRDRRRWDGFVQASPEATFFHLSGWRRVIERAFGHRTHFLYAAAGGAIVGVLPLAEIRSRLFGDALVSLPFCVYGGIAAETETARAALDRAARELAVEARVGHLEYRHREGRLADARQRDVYATFRRTLHPDPQRLLQQLPRKRRAMIRKAERTGLRAEHDAGVERFYAAYAANLHRLGTPVLPRRYFELLRETFGPACDVLSVAGNDGVLASVLSFRFRDEIMPYYAGACGSARAVAAHDFMYWALMREACLEGRRVFDFGRSKRGTGAFDYKRHWGFEPQPLAYEYRLYRCRDVPDNTPLNPRYRRFIALWQHLPLWAANALGPRLSRYLG